MESLSTSSACEICGALIHSHVPANWHPHKLRRRAERDMQEHLATHSFAEVLRSEIRKDLGQVPEEERPGIVRDIYRHLLGTVRPGAGFALNAEETLSLYSIDEALGSVELYQLWRSANRCRDDACLCRASQ
jgi:hypothetical protein